jgi:hypothetical protein
MPQTNANQARELAKNSTDCSFLLSHLIRQNEGRTDAEAKNILELILDLGTTPSDPTLKATATGWYGSASPDVFNPVTGVLDGHISNKSVCFTECTLSGLKAHRDLFQVKYGLAFDRDSLFEKGANPCLNIRESLLRSETSFVGTPYTKKVYNFIPTDLQPFVNVIHSSFDATHEREWRYPGNMKFEWNEVRFVFCPERDFSVFENVQSDAMPCLFDLAWLDRI